MTRAKVPAALPEPRGFRVARDLPIGRHRLLDAFPGLDRLAVARRLEQDSAWRQRLFEETSVELVDQDVWMYVAPHEVPHVPRSRGWKPVITPDHDCVVVGESHLRESPLLVLFMDIYHELCHVIQRRQGANLWEPGVSYVDRWTEVEAYRFVVHEARELGASDEFLRDYLKVEWITRGEYAKLLGSVGVAAR